MDNLYNNEKEIIIEEEYTTFIISMIIKISSIFNKIIK